MTADDERPPGPRVRRVVPDLPAPDPAAAASFYTDVLGFESTMDLGWIVTLAASHEPTLQISMMREDASATVQPAISVEVDDVDAAYEAAARLDYEIVHPLTDEPWGVRRFFVRDGAGNVINVLSHT